MPLGIEAATTACCCSFLFCPCVDVVYRLDSTVTVFGVRSCSELGMGWDGMGAEQQIWDGMGAVQQLGADDVGLVSHGSFSQLGHALAYDAFCGAFVSVALYAPSDTRSRPYV